MTRQAIAATLTVLALAGPGLHAQQAPLPAATGMSFHSAAATIVPACDAAITRARAQVAAADAVPMASRSFANTLGRVEHAAAALGDSVGAWAFLYVVSPDSATRDASQTCSQHLSNLYTDVGADPGLYAISVALAKPGVLSNAAQRKVAELYEEQGRHAGAGLDSAKRMQIVGLFKRLHDVERDYGVAIAADTTTVQFTDADVKGVPPQLMATLKKSPAGTYTVAVNEATFGPVTANAASSSARRRYFEAYFTRGGAANVKRVDQALVFRDSLAHLFGFPNWASYQLDTHMVKDPARVMGFLTEIDTRLAAKTKTELSSLAEMKRANGDSTPLAPYDISFYNAMLRRTKYKVDPEEIRQYFPVDHVLQGVFSIYEQLLGVKFTELKPADAWAPGVREYAVSDAATKKPLGWIYLDLYPRPNKYEHFATFTIRQAIRWSDGSVDRPISAIVGNWPTAAPGKPALLSHGDVVTFFHEFGHLMAGTLVNVPYPTLGNLRQDFVEAPSQMLENWMWQPSVLARVSSNVVTGKPLPPELIDRMIALRQMSAGYGNSLQAFLAMYDMRMHSSATPLDTKATWDSVQTRMAPGVGYTGAYPAASFGHFMSGYDAGYYGYLWSKAYAQDMFTRFARDGAMNVKDGLAYRHDILEPGGLREPDDLLREFLGRPLDYTAFYRDLGITNP